MPKSLCASHCEGAGWQQAHGWLGKLYTSLITLLEGQCLQRATTLCTQLGTQDRMREKRACPTFRGCSEVSCVGLLWGGTQCCSACGQTLSGTRMFRQNWRGKDACLSCADSPVLTGVMVVKWPCAHDCPFSWKPFHNFQSAMMCISYLG